MASVQVRVRMTSQLVIRESDARTLFLIAVYVGRDPLMPQIVRVVDPHDEE